MDFRVPPMDTWIIVLGAVGIGQILMLLLVAAGESSRPSSPIWLSLFLISIGATLAGDFIASLGLSVALAWVTPPLQAALVLIGPTLWLYTRSLTERDEIMTLALVPHFVPFAFLVGLSYLQLRFLPADKLAAVLDPELDRSPGGAELLWLAFFAAQILAYLVAVVRRIRQSRARLTDEFSNLEHRTLAWIALLCALVGAVLAAWVLTWGISHRASNLITTVGSVLAIGLMGSQGLRQAPLFQKHPAPAPRPVSTDSPAPPDSNEDAADPIPSPADPASPAGQPKYARAALSAALAQECERRLETLMRLEKPYLDEDLTLPELAARVGASPHQLSQLFNQHLGESFYDYINRHRIAAFQRVAVLPANARRALLDIALDCGFGSKSTFNAVFKRQVGMSPSAWRQRATAPEGSAEIQRRP